MTHAEQHRERLWPPGWWWIVAVVFGGSIAWALGFWFSTTVGWFTLAAGIAIVVGSLWWYGSLSIVVDDSALAVGGARVGWENVGRARVLDRAATRERLGVDADAAAALFVRSYVPDTVEVLIDDPDDPHPYWLISSRRAPHLAACINARETDDE